jgi:hypothetical protein
VEVRQCEWSGVCTHYGASITLIGAKTTVHHNCTKGDSATYGLQVYGSSASTIQVFPPLTKEQVSLDNGGGGNWGAEDGADINRIKNMNETEMAEAVASTARGEVRVPEDCTSLKAAVGRVHGDDPLTTIVVGKGEHQIDGKYLQIASAMNIVGDPGVPKEEIEVLGGITFNEGIQGNCHLQHLTLRQAQGCGVYGDSSFTMDDVLVEQCGETGVHADGTGVVGRCTNVEVRQCGRSGVFAGSGAFITLIGDKTMVHHNCTKGNNSNEYGLKVFFGSSSTIQLVAPLTKEQIAIDNGGGGNWGADWNADINQIKTIAPTVTGSSDTTPNNSSNGRRDVLRTLPTFMQRQILAFFGYQDYTLTGRTCHYLHARWTEAMTAHRMTGTLFVPTDNGKTLKEAVDRVTKDERLTTIVLGTGQHHINGESLEIASAMNIVGDPGVPKEEVGVVGGITFKEGIQGNCHLQHLTLRQAKGCGVLGGSSFTMDDVLVEQCGDDGVVAAGTGVVGRCTNVEVRQCGMSGVAASYSASITLIGAKTTVHHNCTDGDSDQYGLAVYNSSSSTIQLVSPLMKEQVALDNGGGGNWGAGEYGDIHQIKTIGGKAAPEAARSRTNNCCICV